MKRRNILAGLAAFALPFKLSGKEAKKAKAEYAYIVMRDTLGYEAEVKFATNLGGSPRWDIFAKGCSRLTQEYKGEGGTESVFDFRYNRTPIKGGYFDV